ncbi:hypothetical protein EJB05_42540 [Eragrostis curvula]|uniref:Histone-lysine N-methyltransferase n=1 Tax=Eragrostis curvula TaxID=38414 RepID=A0A5J9TCP0_9POAL|nr:hypothetical protein EJB05_42540 [Eragrostis curvula]
MGRAGSSSSGHKVDEEKQIASVFEELISNIVPGDFNLPPGELESDYYYVPIKRNVYLTKRRIEDYGISCSCVPSGSSVSCGEDYQCGMLFSCCSSNCKCDSKCANKSFQRRPLKKTKLIRTEECGFGLVAEEGIKKGEFVMEYVGEVIDAKMCEERLWKMRRKRATKFYLCEVSSNMIIDSTNKGNMSRFINHSCEPNTEMQKWTIDRETRVGIFAIRDIKKGEKLTYDSNFVQFGAHQVCHCGASKCKKILGKMKSVKSIVLDNGSSAISQDQRSQRKRKPHYEFLGQFVRLWHPREKISSFATTVLKSLIERRRVALLTGLSRFAALTA